MDKTVKKKKAQVKGSNKKFKLKKKSRKALGKRIILVTLSASLVLIVLYIIIVGVTLFTNFTFKINTIDVKKGDLYTENQIIEAADIGKGENLLTYDLNKGISGIQLSLPYADNVKIEKKIPDKLVISLEDAVPELAIKTPDGRYLLISQNDRNLELTDEIPEGVVEVKGIQLLSFDLGRESEYSNKNQKDIVSEIITRFSENELEDIKCIDLTDMFSVSLNYSDKIELILGVPEDIEYKSLISKEILNSKIGDREKGRLDVSRCKKGNRSYFLPEYLEK